MIRTLLDPLSLPLLLMIIASSLFVLARGADLLVEEAVSLSVHWGVPKMIIGATVVSLGTTLPEASVSIMAAIGGNPDLALGNAIGSIIANTGLIIGLAATLGKLPVDPLIARRQGRVMLYTGLLLVALSLPFLSSEPQGRISQSMGWLFLFLLVLYNVKSLQWSREGQVEEASFDEEARPVAIQLLKLLTGLVLVIASSKIMIPTVEITALRIGIAQSVIAATLVAFGTSLPELVTAVTAVKKGHGELAVGNVVGANILNVLFVIGSSAAVARGGLVVPPSTFTLQIPTMLIILFVFRLFSISKDQAISKKEGLSLTGIYLIYLLLSYTWI